jgi:hypothetical protein
MPPVKFEGASTLPSGEQLATFEADCGFRLPDDYRTFLSQHNGGRPFPNRYDFFSAGFDGFTAVVTWFYGLGSSPDLRERWHACRSVLRARFLPIAAALPEGHEFLLRTDSQGGVHLWHPGSRDWLRPVPVAESFDEFLSGLYSPAPA